MWFLIRLSKAELQALATLAATAVTEDGTFTEKHKLVSYYVSWGDFCGKKKKKQTNPQTDKIPNFKGREESNDSQNRSTIQYVRSRSNVMQEKMTGKQDEEGGDEDGRFTLRDKE